MIASLSQGGRLMDAPLSTLPHITPVQVWPQLAADYRRRVLRYLAQWALNLATTTPEPLPSEVIHEHAGNVLNLCLGFDR